MIGERDDYYSCFFFLSGSSTLTLILCLWDQAVNWWMPHNSRISQLHIILARRGKLDVGTIFFSYYIHCMYTSEIVNGKSHPLNKSLGLDNSVMLQRFLMITINLQSNVSEMIDAVKAAFIERLDGNSWLDKATKEASKEKVRAITKMIAFPDQLYNDTYLNNLYAEVSCSCAMYMA